MTGEQSRETPPSDDSEPASDPTVVVTWRGDGADCAACGTTVRRAWVEGGERVCGDCRSW